MKKVWWNLGWNGRISRISHLEVFCEWGFWKNLCQTLRKIPVLKSLFNGVSGFENCNFNRLLLSFAKFFLKGKTGLELVPWAQFQHDFWRKIFLNFSNWPHFVSWFWIIVQNICKWLLLNQLGVRCMFSFLKSVYRRRNSMKNIWG